jgi:type II secretory ATPase GspE/PulE/Tfp pilus assembly ATPase PilB-like protein
MRTETSTLAEILLAKGFVTEDVLADAQFEQRAVHKPLGRILVERGVINETQLLSGLAEQMSLEFVELRDQQIDPMAVSLVPDALARRHGIIPIGFDDEGRLRLAMSDPANVLAIDDVRTITERPVLPVVATHEEVLAAIEQYRNADATVESVASELDLGEEPDDTVDGWVADSDNAPIVRFVNAIIQRAVGSRASDIHIDHETAQIGMEAALTGHLVLSTLHTNDAPSAVTRLTEMGIDGFLVGSAVDCVLAQRLARRLCDACREPYQPSGEQLRAAGLLWRDGEPLPTLWRAVGCRRCGDTGYRGRLAIHEVMEVSESIENLIVAGAATDQIRDAARDEGMLTLREDGLAKVLLGHTTLKEIARVIV